MKYAKYEKMAGGVFAVFLDVKTEAKEFFALFDMGEIKEPCPKCGCVNKANIPFVCLAFTGVWVPGAKTKPCICGEPEVKFLLSSKNQSNTCNLLNDNFKKNWEEIKVNNPKSQTRTIEYKERVYQ